MVTKKTPTKEKEEVVEKETANDMGKYFYGVGRRKTAVAQVRIYPTEKADLFSVNDKKLDVYFCLGSLVDNVKLPFEATGHAGKFNVTVHVMGGGINSQSDAIRLGISRALIIFDETLRKALKDRGFLTRDARKVERKKAGLKKARKSPQWAKR